MHHHVRPANRVVTVAPGRAPAATTAIDQQKANHRVPRSAEIVNFGCLTHLTQSDSVPGQVWAIKFFGVPQPPRHRDASECFQSTDVATI